VSPLDAELRQCERDLAPDLPELGVGEGDPLLAQLVTLGGRSPYLSAANRRRSAMVLDPVAGLPRTVGRSIRSALRFFCGEAGFYGGAGAGGGG
jgi:hypothetical protein